ncbi:MAG TPA: hypothetical protein VK841_08125 [Polyangiaceae bacterium]|jgi:hypothetical protein|nr:hypothetical protein [Polyangiaceae bacterium]
MSELNQDAAALLRSGRAAFRPDTSDRARVLALLRQTLGDSAVSGESGDATHADPGAGARSPAWKSGWTKLFGAVSVLAVGASVTIAAHPWTKTRAISSAPVAQAPLAEPPLSPPTENPVAPARDDAPAPAAFSEPAPAVPRARAYTAPHASGDSLAEEVRLLSAAERELNEGSRAETLATLAEHERRFPHGALTEARLAVRAEALCGLGRRAEARADLHKLARAYPASPHLDAARKLCGAEGDSP